MPWAPIDRKLSAEVCSERVIASDVERHVPIQSNPEVIVNAWQEGPEPHHVGGCGEHHFFKNGLVGLDHALLERRDVHCARAVESRRQVAEAARRRFDGPGRQLWHEHRDQALQY